MPLTFSPAEIPTESESTMLANLPTVGHLYYFFNSNKGGNVYSIDSDGNIVFVASKDDDCCTCKLAAEWLCGLNEALATGAMTAAEYQTAIDNGFNVQSVNDGSGNCSIVVGVSLPPATSVSISDTSASVAALATKQLTAHVNPLGADQRILWVSTGILYATVDQTGLVTGVATGSATIYAYSIADPSKFNTCSITVP